MDVWGLLDVHVDPGEKAEREQEPHGAIPPNPERARGAEDAGFVNGRPLQHSLQP